MKKGGGKMKSKSCQRDEDSRGLVLGPYEVNGHTVTKSLYLYIIYIICQSGPVGAMRNVQT